MKKIAFLFLVSNLTVFSVFGQHLELPKTNWKDYGFQKQVEQVGIGYYTSHSKGYDPAMLDVYTFNNEGHIRQNYFRIFGKYASETSKNYVYENGKLDSINTFASSPSFNSKQKLHYNKNGVLDSITASGFYSNFTDYFKYAKNGEVSVIERKHKKGNTIQTIYNSKKNYVHEKEIDLKGNSTEQYFIYDGKELFASINFEEGSTVTFYDPTIRNEFETTVSEDALAFVFKWRDLKTKNKADFQKKLDELQKKTNSKITHEIPVETVNEHGDWIKRLQFDRRFADPERRLVFKVLMYLDGTKSGSTEYDLIFEGNVSHIK